MYWSDPSIDLTSTLIDLRLEPLPARILPDASLRIAEKGLQALITTAILSSAPHRIRTDPDRIGTGYHLPGGRALRAAVMVRALMLLHRPSSADPQLLLTAAMLGNLVPAGSGPAIDDRCRWLHDLVHRERDHLAEWGCDRARAREVIRLSAIAAHHQVEPIPARIALTPLESKILRASRAAARGRPFLPRVFGDPIELPAWMDPDRSSDVAAPLLLEDLSSTHSHRMPYRSAGGFSSRK